MGKDTNGKLRTSGRFFTQYFGQLRILRLDELGRVEL